MKTFRALEEQRMLAGDAAQFETAIYDEGAKRAKTAAFLSIFPGLGQLYNGEMSKGWTFVAVSVLSYTFCLSLIFSVPALQALQGAGSLFGLQVDWITAQRLSVSPVVIAIVFGLFLSYVAYAANDAYDHAIRKRQGALYPRYVLSLPESTSGSYLAHYIVLMSCAVLALLWAVPPTPITSVTNIEFIPPAPPAPPPAPKKRHVEQPKPVQITTPQPIEKPIIHPTPTPPVPVVAQPVAIATTAPSTTGDVVAPANPYSQPPGEPAGGTGDSSAPAGTGNGVAQEIDMGPYMEEMKRRIKKAWFPPKGNESKTIGLRFKLHKDGTVTSIRMETSSGIAIADAAAISAVEHAAPFPPLPAGSNDVVTIKFKFDYNVFNGG